MNFLHRLKLYGIGFVLGLFLVYFIFGIRACSGVSDVKLYEMSMQEIHASPYAARILDSLHIPLHYFRYAFKTRDWKINFEKSLPQQEPCKIYRIESTEYSKFRMNIRAEDCGRLLIIQQIELCR